MLLEKLIEYSERFDLLPSLYAEGPVRYWIDLGPEGQFLGMTDTADPSSPRTRRGQRRQLPQVQRSSGIRPLLLADKADYTLGYAADGNRAERTAECHRAYVELLERCAVETKNPEVQAVLNFLNSTPLSQVEKEDAFGSFDASGIISFRVDGKIPIEASDIQAFWEEANTNSDAPVMQCLICGSERPVLERMQAKIKGIPGGQSSGVTLISANAPAFESYGLSASLISPTCAKCGEGFTRGLNALLSGEYSKFETGNESFERDHRNRSTKPGDARQIRTTKGVYVFWTREQHDFDFLSTIETPNPSHVRKLMDSVRAGRPTHEDEEAFYALSLSASGGRAVVRDWMDTTVANAKENLALWFQRQQIVPGFDGEEHYYGLMALANATVRNRKDLPVTTPRALIRSAFKSEAIPPHILHQALRRCQAERRVTRPQAALIKVSLLSQRHTAGHEEDYMVGLNRSETDIGYLCGRLLAELQNAQRSAREYKVNTTIVDKYYGTASSAPSSVFPRLLRSFQNDVRKVRRDHPGADVAIEFRITEITDDINTFPRRLDAKQQGMFALGYFHQRAETFRRIEERRQNR